MQLINNWEELSKVEESETHRLEIEPSDGCGWVFRKVDNKLENYLSTHTFYGSCYEHSSKSLQGYGFNVELKNWDE